VRQPGGAGDKREAREYRRGDRARRPHTTISRNDERGGNGGG